MDDAALSCCSHIIYWKKLGIQVEVVNIFTSFKKSQTSKASNFEKRRKREDSEALKKLEIKPLNLNFIDGLYREMNGKSIYTKQTLFSGEISEHDGKLIIQIKNRLKKFNLYDKVVIPLGIGFHADHLIAKNASEKVFDKKKLIYFVDSPYYLRLTNWKLNYVKMLLVRKISVKKISSRKKQILSLYKSQYDLLFKRVPKYYEILLV